MLSEEDYPFLDVLPLLRQAIDAFGVERIMWASDCTVSLNERGITWAQCLGYLLDSESGRYLAHVIDVLTLDGDKIAAVTAFLFGDTAAAAAFASFGLPPELP